MRRQRREGQRERSHERVDQRHVTEPLAVVAQPDQIVDQTHHPGRLAVRPVVGPQHGGQMRYGVAARLRLGGMSGAPLGMDRQRVGVGRKAVSDIRIATRGVAQPPLDLGRGPGDHRRGVFRDLGEERATLKGDEIRLIG